VTEHARIVQALDRRDADGAQAAMRDHILRSRERMAPFFEMLD
jgi:DNA-binding GntR family transcriptional regulator